MRSFFVLLIASFCVAACAADKLPLNAEKDVLLHTNIDKTDVNLLLPAKVSVIQIVLVNPADKNVAAGNPWCETMRHLGGAHMGVMMENVDKRNNRPASIRKTVAAALAQFAEESGHPELVNVPYLWAGFSKGGGFSATEAQELHERTIGFGNVCGWAGDETKDLSTGALIVIGGIADGFKMLDAIPQHYEPARKKGAPWTLALQWGCGHDYGNATALLMPHFEAIVRMRLPKDANPLQGPIKLNPLKLEDGWLGDHGTWETNYASIASFADYPGDKDLASWLPNKYVACVWRSFVSKDPPVQIAAQTPDGALKLIDFSPKAKRTLVIPPLTSLALNAVIKDGTALKSLSYYDGDVLLGTATAEKPEFKWQNVPSGPRAIYVEYTLANGSKGVSNPALVIVSGETK